MTKLESILHPTSRGLYCPPGDFYIDPTGPVDRAVITHGHADHARSGHDTVLATPETMAIMATRYGETFCNARQAVAYGQEISHRGVKIKLTPAGHVLGSAQIVIEFNGKRLIASGDYKRRHDPTCEAFEVESCDVFISEATFALPVFRHPDDRGEIDKLLKSVRRFPDRTHLVGAYALGKAQRVIKLIREAGYDDPIFVHGAMIKLCTLYEAHGIDLGPLEPATLNGDNGAKRFFKGKIVVGPPSAFTDKWARRFADPVSCFASGWMRIRQRAKQRGVEMPLILSDHADWDELTQTIDDIQPQELWVTHGRDDALLRWAELRSLKARPLSLVGYDDENE